MQLKITCTAYFFGYGNFSIDFCAAGANNNEHKSQWKVNDHYKSIRSDGQDGKGMTSWQIF